MNSKYLLALPFLLVGCLAEADHNNSETADSTRKGGYETPTGFVSNGADDYTELGPDSGTNNKLSGFPAGNPDGVEYPDGEEGGDECVDLCRDEGFTGGDCRSFCDGFTGSPPAPGDNSCDSISDSCLRCVCEDPNADLDECGC